MTDQNCSRSQLTLSQIDLGEHIHQILQDPSTTEVNNPKESQTTLSRSGYGEPTKSSHYSSCPSLLSPLSAERARYKKSRRNEAQRQRILNHWHRNNSPPPRLSSTRETRLTSFRDVINPNSLIMEHLSQSFNRLSAIRQTPSGQLRESSTHRSSHVYTANLNAIGPSPYKTTRKHTGLPSTHIASHLSYPSSDLRSSQGLETLSSSSLRLYPGQDGHGHGLETCRPLSTNFVARETSDDSSSPPCRQDGPRLEDLRPELPAYNSNLMLLYTISYLIFFSIFGTLARIALERITFYPGAPLNTTVVWVNLAGSLIMGFLIQDRNMFLRGWGAKTGQEMSVSSLEQAHKEQVNAKGVIPLYVGLTTGFCGSFTTFSGFMLDTFLALSNNLVTAQTLSGQPAAFEVPKSSTPVSRYPGFAICAILAIVILNMGLSIAAAKFGSNIAETLNQVTSALSLNSACKVLDRVFVPIAWLVWLVALMLAIWPPDRPGGPAGKPSWDVNTWRSTIFSLLFAPPGCLLRYFVSRKFNQIAPTFPLGTFCCNIFGTAVLGMVFNLKHLELGHGGLSAVGGSRISCQILGAVSDGFCGCLTTVSTLVAELILLGRRGYIYATATLLCGFCVLLIIMGSIRWTVGFGTPLC